jgi:Mor family transcriptional regulator
MKERFSGDSQRALAARYGVSQTTIWAVLNRKNWVHVP